jgi:hypothetical protein
MSMPAAAVEHYKLSQRLQGMAQLWARRAWAQVQVGMLSQSWEIILRNSDLVGQVSLLQVEAAASGASYGARSLAAQGSYVVPDSFVDPAAFGGWSSDGRSLSGALYSAVPYTKNLIGGGMAPALAKVKGGAFLELNTKTQVADAGRGAAGVDVAVRASVGYVRMLNPPSCSRCTVLAGRFYRWNAGFLRHPGCDCIHVPTKGAEAAKSEGLVSDPYEAFREMSEAEQDRTFTKAGAQAIRDGGDIFQVVNSRRGMKPGGLITTESTSSRGNFGRAGRLTPEGIYSQGLSREQSLKLLESNGYVLPGGQNPLGVIRGQAEGFGALGRGGASVGVRNVVEEARSAGVRTGARATATAAERRVIDAQANWDAVRAGRNPFGKTPLTPVESARAEDAYRKTLATDGEIFAR